MLLVYAFHTGRWAACRAFSPNGDSTSTAATCPVVISETQAPQDNVGFSCKLHAVVITASPADTQMSGTAFPYSHFRKTQPARSKSNKIPQNGGVWGFLKVKHHPLKKRFSVLEAEKWLAAEGSLHPKHNNPCESSYFGNELSDQTQKQQGNFHTNVIAKLQHRWYEIPQIPVEIFQYTSLR